MTNNGAPDGPRLLIRGQTYQIGDELSGIRLRPGETYFLVVPGNPGQIVMFWVNAHGEPYGCQPIPYYP